jgi:hypothetical protein
MTDDTTPPEPFTITLPPALIAEARVYGAGPDETEQVWPAEWCPGEVNGGYGCGKPIEDEQPVRKVRGEWVHDACARKAYAASTPAEAWILLADAVAARPHTFKATEIRTIISNVVRIASLASVPSVSRSNGDDQ